MEIAALGLRVDGVQDANRAAASLDNLTRSGERAESATGKMGNTSSRSSREVRSLADTSRRASSDFTGLSRRALSVASSLGLIVSASVAIRSSISTISSFEQSMARVQAISRATADEMRDLEAAARQLGATTEYSASQAADGLQFLSMAGFTASESIAAIPDVLNLATAASLDLGRAADIASNVMSGFGIAADNASRVTDVLAASSSRANTDVNQLGDAMSYVGPVASALSIDIGDTAAAIGVLSDAGIQGSSAGTGLRRVLSSLANPTSAAAKTLKELDVSLEDVNPQANDLVDIIDTLAKAGIGASEALTIFGDRGGPALLALVENNPRLAELTAGLRDVEGEAARMANTMRDNLAGDVKGMFSAIQELTLALNEGSGLGGGLRNATQRTTEFFRAISTGVSDGSFAAVIEDLNETTRLIDFLEWRLGSFQSTLGKVGTALSFVFREGSIALGVYGHDLELVETQIGRLQSRMSSMAEGSFGWLSMAGELEELEQRRSLILALQGDIESTVSVSQSISQELAVISSRMAELAERGTAAAGREISALTERQEELLDTFNRVNSGTTSQADALEKLGGAVEGWRSPLQRVNDEITLMSESVERFRIFTAGSNDAIAAMVSELEAEHRQLTMTSRELVEYNLITAMGEDANKTGAKSVINHVLALYDQNEALKKTKEAAEEAAKEIKNLQSIIDRYDRSGARVRQLTKDHKALTDAIKQGIPGAVSAMDEYYDSLITVEHRTTELAISTEESADWMATSFDRGVERMRDGIGDFFERMIVDGKASFSDLTDLFKKMIAEMIATAAANRIMIGLGIMGAAGGASAGGLGSGGGGIGLGDILSMKNLASTVQGGFAKVGTGSLTAINWVGEAGAQALYRLGYQQAASAWSTGASTFANGMVNAGQQVGGWFGASGMSANTAAGVGSLATAGAGWAGGRIGSDLGLALTGKEGSGWGAAGGATIGAIVGSYFPVVGNILGSAIGGLIGGVVDSIFGTSGWNTTRGGLQLGFGDEGFDPMQWERQTKRGGLFGSTKRRYRFNELDDELDAALSETYDATLDSVRELYGILGVAVEDGVLEGVQIATLQIGTAGKSKQSQEAIEQQITQWFADLQEAAVQAVDSSLNTETLTLYASSLASVNEVFGAIGLNAYDVSIEGGKAAAQLLALSGGIENLLTATDFYYQNFYSEQERLANLTEQTTSAFEALGKTMPGSRDEFRRLVESIDQTTEAGQVLFLQLLNLAPAMSNIAGAAEAAYQEMVGAAQSGLQSAWGALEASIRAEQQSLTAAWNDTRSSIQSNIRTVQNAMRDTERVATSLSRALDQMRGNELAFDPSVQFSQASDYLRSVLASGGLGDQGELDRALAAVASPSTGTYETLVDYQRDFLQTAAVVEELEARAGKQLSAQERSVTALERQLALSETQYAEEMARLDGVLESQARMIEAMLGQQDWLASINAGILSIPEAIAGLGGSLKQAQQVQRDQTMSSTERMVNQAYRDIIGREAEAAGLAYWTSNLTSGQLAVAELNEAIRRAAIENKEIPGFSGGGIASGPSSGYYAELHGTEAVIPIPNGYVPVKIQGNDSTAAEISALRQELKSAQQAIAKNTAKMAKIMERWEFTGMPEEREL